MVESWKHFLSRRRQRSRRRQICPTSPILFNIVLEVLTTAITKKKKKNWKGRSKTVTICRWQDTTYRKPWRCCKNLLELTTEFSKLAEYKINCSTIHNTCDMEAMQMPSDRWMGRWVFVCVCVCVCVCWKIYSNKNKVGGLKLSDFNPTANYSNQDSCYSSSTDIIINIWSIYFLKVTKEN